MSRFFRFSSPAFLVAGLLMILGAQPLRAQLDPRLQNSPTDFLDLFQEAASSSTIKPEILTIFDFSGSMASLMFHPQYVNNDKTDSDSYNYMSFALTPGVANPLTLTMWDDRDSSNGSPSSSASYATYTFTVGGSGSAGTPHAGTSGYTFTAITSTITTFTAGAGVTFTTKVYNPSHSNNNVDWYIMDGNNNLVTSGKITQASGSGATDTDALVTTVPALSTGSASATLQVNPQSGANPCATCTMNTTLTGTLIKPNGSAVTATDANLSKTSGSTLNGVSYGASDIRNWVRAASHARFSYQDGSNLRTIDIPIPWKIHSGASTGNPLSSLTAADSVSNTNPEFDLVYSINGGDDVFSYSNSDTSAQTSTTLQSIAYRPTYIAWLFQGKYLYGPNVGKYVAYDAATPTLVGGQTNVAWGQGYGTFASTDTIIIPFFQPNGTWSSTGGPNGNGYQTVAASSQITSARSRCQAVKQAAITTWIAYQSQVFWAYRFLDVVTEVKYNNGNFTTTTIDNNSTAYQNVPAGQISSSQNGCDSAWTLLNNTSANPNNSVNGMQRLAALEPNNGTPLTFATARGLAQFTDPSSVFNAVETGTNAPPQCMSSFFILFTDGLDNNGTGTLNGNSGTPYITSGTTGSAATGNKAVLTTPANIRTNGSWWNLFTFAGIAAHMADNSLGTGNYETVAGTYTYPTGENTPDKYLPFAIASRNGVQFQSNHRIQTMTVGVSLGGQFTDTSSPKRSLFLAAAVGDPSSPTWDLSLLQPFTLKDPNDPSQGKTTNSICYFDGTNPDALLSSLNSAFIEINGKSNVGATANPNLPFIGGSLGNEIYLGSFLPPAGGGVLWQGDLLMFPTIQSNGVPVLVNSSGTALTTLNASSAQWSAATSLANRGWTNRNLYTRFPATSTTALTSEATTLFQPFSDQGNAFTNLAPYVCTDITNPSATQAQQAQAIQWAAGGNIFGTLDANNRPTTSRSNIMGDIIDSTPTAQEYTWSYVSPNLPTGPLTTFASGNSSGNRFRLIIVGDNQGWLHGFGEVSNTTNSPVQVNGNTVAIASGAVDELWAFMPTDFLPYLDTLETQDNPHRFMADGSANIYFLDLPTAAAPMGNGTVDANEHAVALFGLGKGGRSYYALDVHNPFTPALLWSIRPDEAAYFPASRVITGGPALATVRTVIANMGFSTCSPSLGRILFKGSYHDVVFFGGGYSNTQTEAKFLNGSGGPTKLGRSVLAVDVYSGMVLAAADMTQVSSTMGSIPAGLVPFEAISNSGLVQRAYFMDYSGGLWCWDQEACSTTSPFKYYRVDSSDLSNWAGDGSGTNPKIRQVYQDGSGKGALYTTFPAPFVLGQFPGNPYTSGQSVPAVTGIAMVSGDRNNPMDYSSGYPLGVPNNFRLTMVYDRQDNPVWGGTASSVPTNMLITDSLLSNFSNSPGDGTPVNAAGAAVISPGNASYYLAPENSSGAPITSTTKFGYYINFPPIAAGFVPKGITPPMVVSGSLFYSIFSPTTANVCSGGTGTTTTDLICSELNPAQSASTSLCQTGSKLSWAGVSSAPILYGTQGVFVGGTTSVANPLPGQSATQLQFNLLTGNAWTKYPKARVWRTIH